MSTVDHHRMFSRSSTHFPVTLLCEDGTEVKGVSENVGFGGVLVSGAPSMGDGARCSVSIDLSDEIFIEGRGEVIRVSDDGVVVEFLAVRKLDLVHLDALIRYNAQDDSDFDEVKHEASKAGLALY